MYLLERDKSISSHVIKNHPLSKLEKPSQALPYFFFEAHIKHLVMASKYAVFGFLEMAVMMMMMLMSVTADLAKDRQECADQLVGLGTCLPYVGGEGKTPTIDCCSGLKQVLQKSKKCLCVLIKDRNDPNLGLKINATLALGLPTACHAPTNVSECPGKYKYTYIYEHELINLVSCV